MKNLEIRKSNALIEASYRLSVAEHRIILTCLAQAQRGEGIRDDIMYTVQAQDVADRVGISKQTAYEELKAASDRLFDRYISVPYAPDGKRPRRRRFRWVQEDIQYEDGKGAVQVRFSPSIVPYLRELSERYTVYSLNDVSQMTSAYGIRLYELLMQWANTKNTREVDIDWLRTAFQLDDKYPAFKDLRTRVIEPAVSQVNEHSPLKVEWQGRKTGRRTTHIVFTFGEKAGGKASRNKPAKTSGSAAAPPDEEFNRDEMRARLERYKAANGQ